MAVSTGLNIALVYGGRSGEHEVSCISAAFLEKTLAEAGYTLYPVYIDRSGIMHLQRSVSENADNHIENTVSFRRSPEGVFLATETGQQPVDFAFPIVHGTTGEDGRLQGFFDMLELPYAGSGHAASAVSMDKYLSRNVFADAGLPQVKYMKLEKTDFLASAGAMQEKIKSQFKLPLFIKPCNMGSSVGVHRVASENELEPALSDAFRFDDHLLCEEGRSVREIELAVIGNFPEYRVTQAGEIKPNHDFYSYEAKYLDENGADLELPAQLNADLLSELKRTAAEAFAAIRGDGFARVDFFIDRDSGEVLLNEINTLPGFTPISMFPQLWAAEGMPGPELVKELVRLGFDRMKKLQNYFAAERA